VCRRCARNWLWTDCANALPYRLLRASRQRYDRYSRSSVYCDGHYRFYQHYAVDIPAELVARRFDAAACDETESIVDVRLIRMLCVTNTAL
jgi:hypothetical protein